MVKGDAEVQVRVKNFSEKDQKLKDCDITELYIYTSEASKLDRGITLPGGIKITDRKNSIKIDTIKEKYGTAKSREVDTIGALIYEASVSKSYDFYFSSNFDDQLVRVKIQVDAKR